MYFTQQVTESKGDHAGMGRLLDFILRSDNPQWYKTLQDALSAAGYDNLALGDQEGNVRTRLAGCEPNFHFFLHKHLKIFLQS